MNSPKLEWFLAVAEAGGISKAAEKLFASQQSVSAYIKRLEAFYGVTLFRRSPGFALTAPGEILYRNAKQIVQRDRLLRDAYEAIRNDQAGRIRFGLTIARSQIFLPRIIPEYAARYPGVTIVLCEGSTVALGKQLSEREIDLYLGKDLRTGPLIRKETLSSDRLFAIATNQLMERQFGQRAAALAERFRKGVYLRELEELPFVTVDPTSKTFQHMDIYCQEHQINFNSVVQVSNTPMLIELCRAGYGAGLCLETFLLQVLQHSADTGQEMLHIFPILDQISGGEIIIAHYEEEEEPRYFSDFKDLVRNTVLSHQF